MRGDASAYHGFLVAIELWVEYGFSIKNKNSGAARASKDLIITAHHAELT